MKRIQWYRLKNAVSRASYDISIILWRDKACRTNDPDTVWIGNLPVIFVKSQQDRGRTRVRRMYP